MSRLQRWSLRPQPQARPPRTRTETVRMLTRKGLASALRAQKALSAAAAALRADWMLDGQSSVRIVGRK